MIRTLICAGLLGTGLAFVAPAPEAQALCLDRSFAVTGGSARREGRAYTKALRKWRRQAAIRYGLRYAKWKNAQNVRRDCKRIGRQHIFTVSALPCS